MSCAHQSIGDVKQNFGRKAHKGMVKTVNENRKINYQKLRQLLTYEFMLKYFVLNIFVQHNISFLTADHLAPLNSKMFPDSKSPRISTKKTYKNN